MQNLQNYLLTAGEDRTLNFTAKDHTGAVLNLTGAVLKCRIARNLADAAVLEKTGAIISASSGTWSVSLSNADTATLSGEYFLQGFATIASAVTVCNEGLLRVETLIGSTT